ncbi:MAG: alpha-amylase family protein [Anaerolineaceae bacterium]|nr:alpha-amylase family protein [Anaerolineaceae bacterium]
MNFKAESVRTLKRLLPRIEFKQAELISKDPKGWETFTRRLSQHFPDLFTRYHTLYADLYDFFYHLEDLVERLAQAALTRPVDLLALDEEREANPLWFQSNQQVGAVCYVDLFSKDLLGVQNKIPYLKELGITYLHLMPIFKMPDDENDGGYAVSSFREVHPPLGTITQLADLSRKLHAAGISLVLDLVINHTSDEHAWATQAKTGDPEFKELYYIFPDREIPDAYERHLREIFPEEHPGSFTYCKEIKSWVWTTFHAYQWDLNYANPNVFNRMAGEMLFLANQGIEIFRLDAVAFIWKELGTNCENLPKAHTILQTFNAVTRIASPAVLFKSEAIVHPDEIIKYISPDECQLSYNPLLMALLWNSLATRKVELLSQALSTRHNLPEGTAWVNYVRCHDDIGWTFSDEDAIILGIKGNDHRHFLNEFYRGRFKGSFARGLPFQENPKTGDCRISGTCASLAGLQKALTEEGSAEVELAILRIALIHNIIMTVGGIPLIYLGDELGTLNDYSYLKHKLHKNDSRWVHRPSTDWAKAELRHDPKTTQAKVFSNLLKMIAFRKTHPVLSEDRLEIIVTGNPHVLGYTRCKGRTLVAVFANFSETEQLVSETDLQKYQLLNKKPIFGKNQCSEKGDLVLSPLDFLILG